MNKQQLFQALSDQTPATLLDLLDQAYDEMSVEQRQRVFGRYVPPKPPPQPVDGEVLLRQIEAFRDASLAGYYYAPFAVNSENWMDIPQETEEWFNELGGYLQASRQLSAQGQHAQAVACFGILYALIDAMEYGEEIIFAEEAGSWMIPGDEKEYITAYLTALAATTDPEAFTAAAIPLIQRDSGHSLTAQVYPSAIRVADAAQRAHLEAEVRHQNIRTE